MIAVFTFSAVFIECFSQFSVRNQIYLVFIFINHSSDKVGAITPVVTEMVTNRVSFFLTDLAIGFGYFKADWQHRLYQCNCDNVEGGVYVLGYYDKLCVFGLFEKTANTQVCRSRNCPGRDHPADRRYRSGSQADGG